MEIERILPGLSGFIIIFMVAYPILSQYHLEHKRNGYLGIVVCEYTSSVDFYEHLFIFASLWSVLVMRILMFQHISEKIARKTILLFSIGLAIHFIAARSFTGVYKKKTFLGIEDEPYAHRVYLLLSIAMLFSSFIYVMKGKNLASKLYKIRVSLLLLIIIFILSVYATGKHGEVFFIFPCFCIVYLIIAYFLAFQIN